MNDGKDLPILAGSIVGALAGGLPGAIIGGLIGAALQEIKLCSFCKSPMISIKQTNNGKKWYCSKCHHYE